MGIPKRVPGVLPSRAQAVREPSQGHLVEYLCRTRGDPRGLLAIRVSQEVEDDFGVHCMDPWPVGAVLQGEGGGHPLSVGHRARDGHRPCADEVSGESDAGGVLAGPAPRRIGGGVAPGLRYSVVPGGAERPRVEVGGVLPDSGWLEVSWSTLSALVSPRRTAGWSCSPTSAPAIVVAQDQSAVTFSLSHAGPPRCCTTRCPVSSGWSSSACTAMCGLCGTSVTTSRAVPRRSSRGLGWLAPICTITYSVWSCACSVARLHWSSVVTSHTGVSAWGRGHRGSGHATSALGSWCSQFASTLRRMYRGAAGGWYAAPCVGRHRLSRRR